jgi:L-histidine N-alpha-methyltransferase
MTATTAPPTAPRTPRFLQQHHEDAAAVRAELAAGLLAAQPHVAPKFLYDTLGSRLFEAITELPEYYPTRTEAAILARHAAAIAQAVGTGRTLVDLGAGNCEKAERLFGVLRPQRYVAVDISVHFLQRTLQSLQRQHPALVMLGLGMDFSRQLQLPEQAGAGPRTLFYPGSSIGNFTPADALRFLRQAQAACQGGALLIGVDLLKPVQWLEPAYDDALQVTAAFNRNLLANLNRLLGTDFALADWAHAAHFNAAESRIEMHLRALRDVRVRWPGGERRFTAGQTLHTESSYKYGIEPFTALLHQAGFARTQCWTDEKQWFAVFVAQAR